jgi:ligand-binding sensor domain-containing protein
MMRCGPFLLWVVTGLLIAAGWSGEAWAQAADPRSALPDIRFEQVVRDTGPSHNTINTIAQDRQGFLWFGTLDGLNRYDGYEFTVYRHDDTDTTSLVDSNVWRILEDRAGRLWVGTNSGLDRFDRASEGFIHYPLEKVQPGAESPYILALHEDRTGTVWAGTDSGLYRYDPEEDRFTLEGATSGGRYRLVGNGVYGIAEEASGALWILTRGTTHEVVLHRLDPQGGTIWQQEMTDVG